MGWRFRKSVKLAPGLRLNLSKSGASVSAGRRGATLNVGKRGTRVTFGIPGTGVFYSTKIGGRRRRAAAGDGCILIVLPLLGLASAVALRGVWPTGT
jgi:hypothetical protein